VAKRVKKHPTTAKQLHVGLKGGPRKQNTPGEGKRLAPRGRAAHPPCSGGWGG